MWCEFTTNSTVCTSAIYGRVMTQLSADENVTAIGAKTEHYETFWHAANCLTLNFTVHSTALHSTTVHCITLN